MDKPKIIEGIMQNPEGITLALDGTIPAISSGFYVSVTNNAFSSVSEGIIEQVIAQVLGNPLADFIGSWYSAKTSEFFIDATAFIATLCNAMEAARMFSQQAIFDIRNMQALYL
ncbi:hypothetical protein JW707_02925 [Candidatus Woesearchaeota archaeon]|nr:hypothetical protein [Candidatus Woesearchaeota archaeon]